jgi:hypothetical protein
MEAGLQNEIRAIDGLVPFMVKCDWGINATDEVPNRIVNIATPGLIIRENCHDIGTSVDGIVLYEDGTYGAIEVKTRIASTPILQLRTSVQNSGSYVSVDVNTELFHTIMPNIKERLQVIHHCVALDVDHCLVVFALTTEILQVIRVNVTQEQRRVHFNAVKLLADLYFGFAKDGGVMPQWPTGTFGKDRCPDKFTLDQTIALRTQALALVISQGKPLPNCSHLLTTLAAIWNSHKTSVDTISSYIASFGDPFRTIGPEMQCWIRLINLAIVQSHLLYSNYSLARNHLQLGNRHFHSMRHLRNSSRTHDNSSAKKSLSNLLDILRTKGHVEPQQQFGPLQHPVQVEFVLPGPKSKRKTILRQFNTASGVIYRCERGGHIGIIKMRQAHCIICTLTTHFFCSKCNVYLCGISNAGRTRKRGRVASIDGEAYTTFTCNGIFHSVDHLESVEEEEEEHELDNTVEGIVV